MAEFGAEIVPALDTAQGQLLSLMQLTFVMAQFNTPLTNKIQDYLEGRQLGSSPPGLLITGRLAAVNAIEQVNGGGTNYWTGPMVPKGHPKYREMQEALLNGGFRFVNHTLQGVEFLADGVGVDDADWDIVPDRVLQPGEMPTPEEQALIDEALLIIGNFFDDRNVLTLIMEMLKFAIAHGRQPLRPRISALGWDPATGALRLQPDPVRSLEHVHLTLPHVADAGIWRDPNTMQRYGVTHIYYQTPDTWNWDYEITTLDSNGNTILQVVPEGGNTVPFTSAPLPLNGKLFLLELKFTRGAVTPDVLSQQDSFNVANTMLDRNTHFAGFAKVYGIGLRPPVDPVTGEARAQNSPGTETYFQPSVTRKVTKVEGDMTGETETVEETAYSGASFGKLEPSKPDSIIASMKAAEEAIYVALRQRFVLMDDKATASGRSREVATGSFLRAVGRYATGVEHLLRELIEWLLSMSAIIQGQPGRYDSLRATAMCRQQVFDPSPQQITALISLNAAGILSKESIMNQMGVTDIEGERKRLLEEASNSPQLNTPQPTSADQTEGVEQV